MKAACALTKEVITKEETTDTFQLELLLPRDTRPSSELAHRAVLSALLLLISRKRCRQAEADEQGATDVTLECEVAATLLQAMARGASDERIATVGNKAKRGEEQPEE
jgi:hypothetical protein